MGKVAIPRAVPALGAGDPKTTGGMYPLCPHVGPQDGRGEVAICLLWSTADMLLLSQTQPVPHALPVISSALQGTRQYWSIFIIFAYCLLRSTTDILLLSLTWLAPHAFVVIGSALLVGMCFAGAAGWFSLPLLAQR